MSKELFAENELNRSDEYRRKWDVIYDAYRAYMTGGAKDARDRFALNVYEVKIGWAKKHVGRAVAEEDVLQQSVTETLVWLSEQREELSYEDMEHTVNAIFRRVNTALAGKGGTMISLNDEDGKEINIPDPEPEMEEQVIATERARLFGDLWFEYCSALVNYKQADPPHAMSLCYARVLPQIRGELRHTGGAPTKAYEAIKDRTFSSLSDESVGEMSENLGRSLRWNDTYMARLDEPCEDTNRKLGDTCAGAVLTVFSIRDFSRQLNGTIAGKMFRVVKKDKDYVARCKNFIQENDKTFSRYLYEGRPVK